MFTKFEDCSFRCSRDIQKIIPELSNKSYSNRLKNLNLPTLKYRHYRKSARTKSQILSYHSILCSLHWLTITERIEYKFLSLTYKVRTTTQPPYLHNLISTQRPRSTRSSSVVTLARPPSSSSLKITDRSFRYASPCLWNRLPFLFVNLILVPVLLFPTYLSFTHHFFLFLFTTTLYI